MEIIPGHKSDNCPYQIAWISIIYGKTWFSIYNYVPIHPVHVEACRFNLHIQRHNVSQINKSNINWHFSCFQILDHRKVVIDPGDYLTRDINTNNKNFNLHAKDPRSLWRSHTYSNCWSQMEAYNYLGPFRVLWVHMAWKLECLRLVEVPT